MSGEEEIPPCDTHCFNEPDFIDYAEDTSSLSDYKESTPSNLIPDQKETNTIDLDADAKREESKKNVVHNLFVWSIRVIWAVVAFLFVIRSIHFILPESWFWLNSDQIQSLDKFLFSGAVGAMLGKFGDRLLK